MKERLEPQDMTKVINFYGDLLYVLNGKVKVYMQDINGVKEDGDIIGMELRAGDYLDPYCSMDHFATQRLKSINKRIRENRIIKMTIQHSVWQQDQSKFFYLPQNIYHLYVKNKNYLSIFSKEDVE